MELLDLWLRRRLTILLAAYIGFILIWNIILTVIGCFTASKYLKSTIVISNIVQTWKTRKKQGILFIKKEKKKKSWLVLQTA